MKNITKLIVFFIAIFALILINPSFSNAETPITDESSLLSAISSADSGATITLQSNITVKAPIVIQKELTINGNGYTVTGSSDWTSTSGNQTMFTAQNSAGKLTLKNINLQNGPKYGVQSYDGATVILDNVSINGFRYGGVLVNGGIVEVRNLHLGYNGTGANNGIEIDKGAKAKNNPTLIMNGVLKSDTNENVVRAAENGYLTEFTITNTSSTKNKVVLTEDSIVLTDEYNNVISETLVPEKATGNSDSQKIIITLFANGDVNRITVDKGATITADLLKSHITIAEGYKIDGFYTDAQYTTEFDFSKAIDVDTSIYAKISKVESTKPEPEANVIEKDETPKTGVENYLGIALFIILFSTSVILFMKKKRGE